jgi:hypothetical protein
MRNPLHDLSQRERRKKRYEPTYYSPAGFRGGHILARSPVGLE